MTIPLLLSISLPTIKYPIPNVNINIKRACKKKRVGGFVMPKVAKIVSSTMLKIINDTERIQFQKAPMINMYL
jgi:hypothetical protein